MGIEQARKWGVCTMNEFRKYLGLKRMFLELSSYVTPFDLLAPPPQNSKLSKNGILILQLQ